MSTNAKTPTPSHTLDGFKCTLQLFTIDFSIIVEIRYVVIVSLVATLLLNRVNVHVNLVPRILVYPIVRPSVVHPYDAVVGIDEEVAIVHLKNMTALMLRSLAKVGVKHRSILV
jgi:hypothetical protein